MNNYKEKVVPILVSNREGSQNGPSYTPLIAASLAEMKVTYLKEYLKSKIIVTSGRKYVLIVWLEVSAKIEIETVENIDPNIIENIAGVGLQP